MKHHVMRDGTRILIKDMEDSHLLNTIRMYKRMASNGIRVVTGGGSTAEDMWGDVEFLIGEDAEDELNLRAYLREAKKRGLTV